MNEIKAYRILLFYKYVSIVDPGVFARDHLKLCKELGLKGRILVAKEGINGTVSGTVENTDQYMEHMRQSPLFSDMDFKVDASEGHAFAKLFVRPRDELVSFRLAKDIDPNERTGTHLTPQQFYQQMQKDDCVILDGRNEYEYEIGHFRNAIRPKVESFRDFPQWIRENLSQYKDKPILTY
ncbi:MAG TPA: rhodanese-related sulfurtransferase, partial [Bacilli bacterium]